MLDLAKLREAYFNPPPEDPERLPTREELWARAERRAVEACLLNGGDPRAQGLGEHGSLIGGAGKPLTTNPIDPDRCGPRTLLPLAWFEHPLARSCTPPDGGPEGAYVVFQHLTAGHLAGYPDRPDGNELRRIFQSPDPTRRERSILYHVFACIRASDLPRLFSRGGLSVYEVARALHFAGIKRAVVVDWINEFGQRPEAAKVAKAAKAASVRSPMP